MSTIQYYIHFLKNAFNFTGRASIEQFFSVIVANFAANLFLTVFGFLLRITGTNLDFIFKMKHKVLLYLQNINKKCKKL